MASFSTTAPQKVAPAHLLEYIAMKFSDLEEFTPLSVMMRQRAHEGVYLRALSLYKLAGET